MSSQNVGTTLVYMAYNTSTGAYVTGDQANHTLKLVKDGTEASPTNASAEVDSTNTPGAYKLALTAAETQFGTVWLGGKSSTANVIIVPITATFEILPTTLDGSNVRAATEVNNDKTGYALTTTEETAIADALLNRDMALGTDTGSSSGTTGRTVRQALRMLRNKWSISGTTQTITKEDDATTSWSQVVTGTPGANPITAVDPT